MKKRSAPHYNQFSNKRAQPYYSKFKIRKERFDQKNSWGSYPLSRTFSYTIHPLIQGMNLWNHPDLNRNISAERINRINEIKYNQPDSLDTYHDDEFFGESGCADRIITISGVYLLTRVNYSLAINSHDEE
jgi:hypothetical protein